MLKYYQSISSRRYLINIFACAHNTDTLKTNTYAQSKWDVTDMSWEDYVNNPLWPILEETVHSIVVFRHHKAYVRDVVLVEQPNLSAKDLALKLNISLGESLVILYELQKSKTGS